MNDKEAGAHDKRSRSDRSHLWLHQRRWLDGAGGYYILVIVWVAVELNAGTFGSNVTLG